MKGKIFGVNLPSNPSSHKKNRKAFCNKGKFAELVPGRVDMVIESFDGGTI